MDYFKQGGEAFSILSIDRRSDGVVCCGGVGTVVFHTTSPSYRIITFDGELKYKGTVLDSLSAEYVWARVRLFISRYEEKYFLIKKAESHFYV